MQQYDDDGEYSTSSLVTMPANWAQMKMEKRKEIIPNREISGEVKAVKSLRTEPIMQMAVDQQIDNLKLWNVLCSCWSTSSLAYWTLSQASLGCPSCEATHSSSSTLFAVYTTLTWGLILRGFWQKGWRLSQNWTFSLINFHSGFSAYLFSVSLRLSICWSTAVCMIDSLLKDFISLYFTRFLSVSNDLLPLLHLHLGSPLIYGQIGPFRS